IYDKKHFNYELLTGYVKNKCWEIEKETRIRVTVCPRGLSNNPNGIMPKPPHDRMLAELPCEIINSMEVKPSPYASKETINELMTLMVEYPSIKITI
ncbi:MAG: hypothetical protein ACLFRI_07485, partial [Candidatus Izemoplasmataceae bacterium]